MRFQLPVLAAPVLLMIAFLPAMRAQIPSAEPLEERRKALNALFEEYWQATLERSPELASVLDLFNKAAADLNRHD